jgi:dimethylargininase
VHAIVRDLPASFADALAAVRPEPPIEVALARAQHAAYRDALVACGATVELLAADEACPDCVFIEDTAVIAGGLALITRPGAPSRRPETAPVASTLARRLEIARLDAPATLDGGDCMRIGKRIYVGRSARTNAEGIAALAATFAPRGYEVIPLDLPPEILHLKCVCSPLDDERILLARSSIPAAMFAGLGIVWTPAEERYAANAVVVGTHVIAAENHPRTHEALTAAGFTVHAVACSEVRKADGSLTCQSLLI